jgi:hypothetical protein
VIRIWEQPLEAFLEGGLGLVPLAPVTNVTEAGLPQIVQRMAERISREAPPEEAGTLWAAAGVLMGLVWPKGLVKQLLENVMILRESAWVQGLLEDGRAEGRVQDRQEVLLQLGRKRFGAPDADTEATLRAIKDYERLNRMSDRLLDVTTWQDLLATP